MVTNLTGMMVQPNKAIVGRNAFAHEAGIHQDGVIKEKLTYEIMRPEDVGIKESKLVMGKHSGRHALRQKYQELGFDLSDAELEKAYVLLKKVADKKKEVFDEDLIVTVRDALRIAPPVYKLKYIQSPAAIRSLPRPPSCSKKRASSFRIPLRVTVRWMRSSRRSTELPEWKGS